MKQKDLIQELRKKQDNLQKWYNEQIIPNKKFTHRCIWITISCTCGHEVTSPYNMSSNGKCSNCGKSFIRVKNKR